LSELPDVLLLFCLVVNLLYYLCAAMQYSTIKLKVKNAYSHFTASYGKEAENRWVLSVVLNVRRNVDDVTSGGRPFQAVAASIVRGE